MMSHLVSGLFFQYSTHANLTLFRVVERSPWLQLCCGGCRSSRL